jgi:hypothetical protein
MTNEQLENVIEFSNSTEANNKSKKEMYDNERFFASTQELNTLALQTMITRLQATANPETPKNKIINANGTWQSISKWGQNDGLDDDGGLVFSSHQKRNNLAVQSRDFSVSFLFWMWHQTFFLFPFGDSLL